MELSPEEYAKIEAEEWARVEIRGRIAKEIGRPTKAAPRRGGVVGWIKNWWWLCGIVTSLLLIFFFAILPDELATGAANREIRSKLKTPYTAEFSELVVYTARGNKFVKGYVTAENEFGERKGRGFRCRIDRSDGSSSATCEFL